MKPCRAHCNKKLKLFVTGYWIFCTLYILNINWSHVMMCSHCPTPKQIQRPRQTLQWRIQEFPDERECQPLSLGQNLLFSNIFAKKCMKLKKIGSGARFPSPPPPRIYQCRYRENCQVTQFYTTHFLSVLTLGNVNTISIWKFDHAVHVNSVYSLWKNAHMWWHLRNLLCKTNCITQMFNAAMFRQRSKTNSWFDQGCFDVEIRVIL